MPKTKYEQGHWYVTTIRKGKGNASDIVLAAGEKGATDVRDHIGTVIINNVMVKKEAFAW